MLVQQERAYQRASYQGKHARAWATELSVNFDHAAPTRLSPPSASWVQMLFRHYVRSSTRGRRFTKAAVPGKNARRIPLSTRRYLFEKMKPGRTAALRLGAAQALGVIGAAAESAVPDLIAVLADGDVRWAAAQSLARIGGKSIPALAVTATNQNAELRHTAVYALGEAGTNAAPAAAVLFDRVLDTNESIRASALHSLSRVGSGACPLCSKVFQPPTPRAAESPSKQSK